MEEASPEKPAPPAMPKKTSDPLPRSIPSTPTARAVAAVAGPPKTEKDSLAAEGGSDAQSTAGSAPSTPGRTPMQSARHDPSTSAPMQVNHLQVMIANNINSDKFYAFTHPPAKCTTAPKFLSHVFEWTPTVWDLARSRSFSCQQLWADYLCSMHTVEQRALRSASQMPNDCR